LYENSTLDTRFAFAGLTPYTRYRIAVRAKASGEVGPAAEDVVITPAEGEHINNVKYYLIYLHFDKSQTVLLGLVRDVSSS